MSLTAPRISCFLVCFTLSFTAALKAQLLTPVWAELSEHATVVRVVVSAPGDCPVIMTDGVSHPMNLRTPVPEGLRPACEFAVRQEVRAASVNGKPVALPQTDPARQ